MRRIAAALVVLLTAVAPARSDQNPVFKSGVEVMEVDVTVVDAQGKPVRDLRSPDFTVTVDGQPRRVISAEFIADQSGPAARRAVPDPYVSSSADRRPGRLIMLAVDRNNIETQILRGALAATKSFINGLAPEDQLGLVTVPPPGPVVEFTTNHRQVIEALSRIVGSDDSLLAKFNVSNYEALELADRGNPIVTERLVTRVCGETTVAARSLCGREVEQEAMSLAAHVRQQTAESVSGFAALLKNLKDVEGAKSLIVLSQGLMLQGAHSEATELALLAAEARVNVNVLLFDAPRAVVGRSRMTETISQDRELREAGLETFASRSRGSLFRVITNPQYIFERVNSEISTHYMLGVEPAEKDRDGRAHQIAVQVGRQSVQIRARRQVQYAAAPTNAAARETSMARVLRSPATSTALPMRLSTYVYRDAAPGKAKLIVAAELDPEPGDKGLDLAIGFVVYDQLGAVVTSGQERKVYSPNVDLPIRYDLTLQLDPGTYRVRLGAIDLNGSSGSVEREVQAWQMTGQELALGDLLLNPARAIRGGELRPQVVLKVEDGQVATYTELYTSKPGMLEDTSVVFEIADTVEGPTLQSVVAEVVERPDRTMRQLMAVVPVAALPPGRYVARATITASGKVVGKLARPFDLVRSSRPATAAVATATSAAVAPAPAAFLIAGARPAAFDRASVVSPEMLRAVFNVMDPSHPAAKGALARARTGTLEGLAMMALEAGDQPAGSIFRGLELLSKGQVEPAAVQFGVALRNPADAAIGSFYLGACYAAVGRDREAVTAWERARAARLQLPGLQVVLAEGWLRLGQPAQALEPLREALEGQPQNDRLRKSLATTQSQLGLHDAAYLTITPFLEKNPTDVDALLVALHALYQTRVEGKSMRTPEQDREQATQYARAYAAANGPLQPLVAKWAEFLAK